MKRVVLLALALPLLGGGVAEGNRAYRSGQVRLAAEVYARRLERGDSSAVVRYNLGTALLRLGRWDDARPHLEAAASARARPELAARAHYNAGNTDLEPVFRGKVPDAERAERLRRSIARYKQALRLAPADPDAKWNLELAQKLLREQPREEERQDDPRDQGGGGGGGGGGQQDDPQPQQRQPEPSPASQGGPSPQISRAEAARILSGAAEQERNAQRELLDRNRGARKAVRDW